MAIRENGPGIQHPFHKEHNHFVSLNGTIAKLRTRLDLMVKSFGNVSYLKDALSFGIDLMQLQAPPLRLPIF